MRATKDGAIVFAYHEIPHRLEEPAVSTGSRTKDLRLGHRHIDHLRAPAVAGDSHSLGIDQAFGNQFPDRILETHRAIDPDQVLHPLARQAIGRASCRKECVSTFRSRWSTYLKKKKKK